MCMSQHPLTLRRQALKSYGRQIATDPHLLSLRLHSPLRLRRPDTCAVPHQTIPRPSICRRALRDLKTSEVSRQLRHSPPNRIRIRLPPPFQCLRRSNQGRSVRRRRASCRGIELHGVLKCTARWRGRTSQRVETRNTGQTHVLRWRLDLNLGGVRGGKCWLRRGRSVVVGGGGGSAEVGEAGCEVGMRLRVPGAATPGLVGDHTAERITARVCGARGTGEETAAWGVGGG